MIRSALLKPSATLHNPVNSSERKKEKNVVLETTQGNEIFKLGHCLLSLSKVLLSFFAFHVVLKSPTEQPSLHAKTTFAREGSPTLTRNFFTRD